ncbi:stage III sporulation protein AG [Pontibacillus sp. HMF3514]|uniref:stage III sporulation protein AG n=1 Tax=Pontibacillus sp. HMF3514 TaxID=2692425 RepID=UPI001F441626|nr:stage III sporulation protein AG [Pontibacillus sp. HMF3514]
MKNNPLDKVASMLKLKSEDGKKPTKMAYVLLVALFGLLILIVSDFFTKESTQSEGFTPQEQNPPAEQEQETFLQKDKAVDDAIMAEVETHYEKELSKLLERIKGVSEVDVMVNLESTEIKVYEKNTTMGKQITDETDKNGGERKIEDLTKDQQVVLTRKGDQEVPLLIQTKKPKVSGVLVVAKGVDHMEVKKWVMEAVSKGLDVPTHRISVMPKK